MSGFGITTSGGSAPTPVPETVITFNQLTPTTVGVVFDPDAPNNTDAIYSSDIDASNWRWTGSAYITYNVPSTTAWNIYGTTTDAGGNKTSAIGRFGSVYAVNFGNKIGFTSTSIAGSVGNWYNVFAIIVYSAFENLAFTIIMNERGAGSGGGSHVKLDFIVKIQNTTVKSIVVNCASNSYLNTFDLSNFEVLWDNNTRRFTVYYKPTAPNMSTAWTVINADKSNSNGYIIWNNTYLATPSLAGQVNDAINTKKITLNQINGAYSLPVADGTANQVMQTNGAGITSWATLDTAIPQSQTVYVDSEYGVDSTGRGYLNKPYLTIEYALANTINTGTITATTTNNNITLTSVSDTTDIKIGQFITGAGIPYGSQVVSKTVNTIVLSKPCTAAATITTTWWTTYNVICVGSFIVLSNIYKNGFCIDTKSHNATINFGAFVLFTLTSNALIPVGFKLGKTNGTHTNSQLHTTGAFSGITANFDHGNYYSIGTGLQYSNANGHFNYSSDVNIEGVFFDCRFGAISYFYSIGGTFNWNSDAYALLGGVRGGGALFSTVKGNITTPTSVNAIHGIGVNYAVYGNIKGSVLMSTMTLQNVGSIYANIVGTTVTLNGGNVGKINMFGSIVGNVVAIGVVGLYGFVDGTITSSGSTVTCTTIFNGSSGIINVGDSIVIYEYASPTYGTLSNTINISTGTFINKGQVRGSFTFTGAGKYINNGTVHVGVATNVPPQSVISNGGSFINNATGVVRNDGPNAACLMTKLDGVLVNNGRMVSTYNLFVNYSANTSVSRDIIIQNSFTNGNGSNGGVGKGTGNILSLLVGNANTDTSATIFDGTNTVTISVVGAGKTSNQISNEFVSLIKASVLLYQFTGFTGFRFYFIGLQSITTTATSLVNLSTTLYNAGGGLSFVPNILVAGTEINNSNLNY